MIAEQVQAVLALVLAALAVMGSPGPSTVSVTATGAAFGVRGALPYATGLVIGTCGVLVAVATGVTTALVALPWLVPVLLVASGAYLLYLAYRIATAPPLRDPGASDAATRPPGVLPGLLLAIANPKAYIAITAVFASHPLAIAHPVVKSALLAVVIVVIHAVWLFVGVSFSAILRRPRASRIVNVALAVILVVITVYSVVTAFW